MDTYFLPVIDTATIRRSMVAWFIEKSGIPRLALAAGALLLSSAHAHAQYADWNANPPKIRPNERIGSGITFSNGSGRQFPNLGAFAALTADSSIKAWGYTNGGGSGAPTGTGYAAIYSNKFAFAALKADGSVSAWGDSASGGSGAPSGSGYAAIYSTISAFAALKADGSIKAWGDAGQGGSGAPTDSGYTDIASSAFAFAAMKADGSIKAWGSASSGGSGAPTDTGYTAIYSNTSAFAALKADGSIKAWGDANFGGSGAPTDNGYTIIYSCVGAFAAMKADGSITAWGMASTGGSGAPAGSGYTAIASNNQGFATLKPDGSITFWGSVNIDDDIAAPTDGGYTAIYSNENAFAALKADGSIKAWGYTNGGGSGAPAGNGYTAIYSNGFAFAAMKADGSITAWGMADMGGSGAPTDGGYTAIYTNERAFAAMKADGSITVWGNATFGGSGAPTDSGFFSVQSVRYYQPSGPRVVASAGVVTPNSAVVACNLAAEGGKILVSRGMVYALASTNANPEIGGAGVTELVESPPGTNKIYSFKLSGLSANTAYAGKAYVTDSDGKYHYSGTLAFTTNRPPVLQQLASVFKILFDFPKGSKPGAGSPLTISVAVSKFKAGSAYLVQMHSTPVTLAEGNVDASGNLNITVTLPDTIASGSHRIVLTGTAEDNSAISLETTFLVDEAGNIATMQDHSWLSQAENISAIATIGANDGDGPAQTITYSISGGSDAAKFAINAATGALSFVTARDFENPTDADANNLYEVIVSATDDGNTPQSITQALTVRVTDAAEPPALGNLTATQVTAIRATLGGTITVDGGSLITARGIVFSLTSVNGAPEIGGAGVTQISSGSTQAVFTANALQLAPGTTYTYRAYATNASGTGYSAAGSFTTTSGAVITSYTWAQFAGSLTGLSGTANGTGSAARFNGPKGIVVDGDGNPFVADTLSYTLRKIVGSTAAVTTPAGVAGTSGSADTSTFVNEKFNEPNGVAWDPVASNNTTYYLADTKNHTLRKSSWTLLGGWDTSTLVGTAGSVGSVDGTGTAARFSSPRGLTVAPSGIIYLADTGNQTIRKIVVGTKVVTTLAGLAGQTGATDATGTSARFSSPSGIAADSSGNLYVADTGNHVIRQIVLSTGVVTTIAGTAGQSGSADGVGAAARFNSPRGITIDSSGNLYVIEETNHIVRRITPDGLVSTMGGLAGTSGLADGAPESVRFKNPAGIAAQGTTLYVADTGNHRIEKGTPLYRPLLGTAGASDTGQYTATLNGWVNPNGKTTTAIIEYGLTNSYGTSIAVTLTSPASGSGQIVSAWISGLTPATIYHYRLTATNVDGTITSGDETFTTLQIPVLTTSVASLSGFSTGFGAASSAQNFTLNASSLAGPVTVAAPAGFEVSADGSSYAASLSLPAASELAAVLYVRLAATASSGTAAGNLTLSSPGVSSKDIALSGTVSIITSLETWRQQHFGKSGNVGNAADLATPDGDGIANLVKYALNITPGKSGAASMPQPDFVVVSGSRHLALSVTRDPTRNDITISIEAGDNLTGWTVVARSVNGAAFTGAAGVSETDNPNGTKDVQIRDTETIDNSARRFMRVRVEL